MSLAEHSEVWPEVELGEVCEFAYGKSLPAKSRTGSGYPVYGSNGPVGLHEEALTAGETIVIGRKGSFGEVHYSPGPCSPIDTTYYITQEQTKAYLPWLARRLRCLDLDQLNRAAAIPGLNRADAYRQTLLRPPLDQQKRIAGILDAADALRAKRREALAQLDTFLQSTFLDMFGDPVTNPMGWEKPPLEDLCEKVIDCPHSTPRWSGSGVICLRTSNLGKGEWNWADTRFVIEEDYTERTRRSEILPNDIILSREGTVGVLALVDEGMRLCMGQRLVQLRVNDSQLHPRFLLNLLLHDLAPERLSRLITGSTSKHLNVKELRKLPVLLPPLDLQRRFAVIVASAEQQKAGQRAHLDELDTLFASLQSRAFRGDL